MPNHSLVGSWLVKRDSFELLMGLEKDRSFWLHDRFTDRMIIGKWAIELREANPLLVLMPTASTGTEDAALSYIKNEPQVEVWELTSIRDNGEIILSCGRMVIIPASEAAMPASNAALVAPTSTPLQTAAPQWPSGPRTPNLAQPTHTAAPANPTQADNAALNKIYQDIHEQDQKTSSDIAENEQKQTEAENKAQSDAVRGMSGAIHAGVSTFIAATKGIKS